MERTTTLKMLLGTYVAAAFVVAPGMAGAAKSYQGDDWSQDLDDYRQMQTCDVETDGKAVHSDAKLRNGSTKQRTAVDSDGGGNACATSARTVSDIIQHRTCEEKPAWPDDCGNWVGTGA